MNLVIFNIDGTLTQSNGVDTQCFIQSFADEFGITDINTDWAAYGHTTDSGIALQIFQEHLGRLPEPSELERLKNRFLHLIEECATELEAFVQIAGAEKMISVLRRAEWAIGVATVGWWESAMLKLAIAGLVSEFSFASAEDGISREKIVTTVIGRSGYFYDQEQFEQVTCVGSSIWDVMTAAQLNLPFVGVGGDPTLQNFDVQTVENYLDCDRFLQALQTATVPPNEKLLQYQQQIFSGKSLPPSYFEALYATNPDPWGFETSDYEAEKYAATIAALPKRYRSAFEIGGSIGVLTEKLAGCCDSLLSVDVSQQAQQRAIDRCRDLPHVRFEVMNIPDQYPDEKFDLTVVSEVGYYWSWEALRQARHQILAHLEVGGHLLLVHWTEYARDYPLNGYDVHNAFWKLVPVRLRHLSGQRQTQYRLDLFERV